MGLGKVVKEQLEERYNKVESGDSRNCDYDRFVFTDCKNVKPKEVRIWTNPRSPDWQIGFFNVDKEIYFDKIILKDYANFSNIVRNYWWNGKEGEEKNESYYSLIKSVKELIIWEKQQVNDLLDYVEGRYETSKHQQIYKLDRNIELRIYSRLEETVVKLFSKYFDNIWCHWVNADLKTENNITYNCMWYKFKNCKEVVPQKLVINATVEHIGFDDADNEVHIPEVVMEEKADLKSIIQNYCGDKKYSLLPHVKTLVIRNNSKVLYDLSNYVNERYKINDGQNVYRSYKLNKNIKIIIEKSGIAFATVKEISDYFVDVLVDDNKPEEYLVRQQPYQKSFQEHFDKYDLETDQIGNLIPVSYELELRGGKFNVGSSSKKIDKLRVNQKLAPQQFVCFHETDKPVVINKIVIKDGGDLRCVLQNAYYNGMDSGFFSLLRTVKELTIRIDRNKDYQVLEDLIDYIEGTYVLNANWRQEQLDRDTIIRINNSKYSLSLSIMQRFRKHFKNISIDSIWTPLGTENTIDQECNNQYIFSNSREARPQKLIVNAKQMGDGTLILFSDADNEMHIPEIIIDQQGCFTAIVCNEWHNNKEDDEKKSGYYSLVQHVKTFIIRNNSRVVKDFADYVAGKYKIGNSRWKLQQLNKNIKVTIKGPRDTFLPVLRISNYFNEVTVDGKQPQNYLATWELWDDPDYKAFRTCFRVHGLLVEPCQYGIEFQKYLWLINCVYNIKKSLDSINSLTVRQKLNIKQFVCFHDIKKPVTVDEIVIERNGDLRNVLQNAYYSNGQSGFFSLLETAKELEIRDNEQAVEDLADYIDGKYILHPKWGIQALNKNMEIKLRHHSRVFSLDVARRLRYYFRNVSIDCVKTSLKTENVIDQECENKYIFCSCRDAKPQTLVVNAKLKGTISWMDLILFNGADGEVCIPKITIREHGSFDAIVCNKWRNNKDDMKYGYYSLVSHVETLNIQRNPNAVDDLDSYVSGDYKIQQYFLNYWKVQKLSQNIIVRINGVKGLDAQINRLKDYFGYIFVDNRKSLRDCRQQMLIHINSKSNDIRQRQAQNKQKQQSINNSVTNIQDAKRRIERARARLGRRRARFQEYLALAE